MEMDDEQDRYWTRPTISSTALEVRKPPTATSGKSFDRPSWITQRARKVFGSYRKDDFAAPDAFLISLGEILEKYPDSVIREATETTTGIQSQCKFPPSIAEVKAFCEDLKRRENFLPEWEKRARKQLAEREHEPVRGVGPPPGRSYEELTKAHPGRVVGAFDEDRQFVYGG